MDVNIWYDYYGENSNSDIRSMLYNLQKIIAIGFKVDNERAV